MAMSVSAKDKSKIQPKYNVSEVIVKFKNNSNFDKLKWSARFNTGLLTLHSNKKLKAKNLDVIDAGSIDNVEVVLTELKKNKDVEYAEPNYKITPFALTDEPQFGNQWGLENSGQTINSIAGTEGIDIKVVPAWELTTGSGVVVGVIDTGIDINHSELQGNIYINTNETAGNGIDDDNNGYIDDVNGWDFINDDKTVFDNATEDTHGTNVAGIISSKENNNGIIGAAPNAKILPLKILSGNSGSTSDAIEAINYAKTMGVKIMNCSWGSSEFNYPLKDAINSSGMTFICSSGNSGNSSISYPASFGLPNIVSVGAIDNKGEITDFTSKGNANDLYAPGKDIYTTSAGNTYGYVSGTSFSSALVSGIAALVKQSVPDITYEEMSLALKNGYDKNDNKKIINAQKAITDALPLNYLKDEDGRLSRAMKYAKMLITPDVAEVLAKHTKWSELDNNEKEVISSFFNVTATEMSNCQTEGLDIIDSAVITISSKKAKISVGYALQLLTAYNDTARFDLEMEGLAGITERVTLSSTETEKVVDLMAAGNKTMDIAAALIAAKTINCPIDEVIKPLGETNDGDDTTFSGEERKTLYNLLQTYNLDLEYIVSYLTQNNKLPSELSTAMLAWQKNNNFYIVAGKVSAYTVNASNNYTIFNKYTATQRDYWSDGTVNIDTFDGMVYYDYNMQTLQGRNGLDLNLGLRFDSEVSDATKTAQESDLLAYKIKKNRSNACYSAGFNDTRDAAHDYTDYIEYTDDTTLEDNVTYFTAVIDGVTHYFTSTVTSTTSIVDTTPLTQTGFVNFYDAKYNLGVGVALNFPILEINGGTMNMHLPDSRKYKIKSSNGNYYLDGYFLKDLEFKTATGTDLTVNSVSAAYQLAYKNGTADYFSSTGSYIGTKDNYGNKIQVHYSNGLISKVYDTADRYYSFVYTTGTGTKTTTISLVDKSQSLPGTVVYTITSNLNSATGKYFLSEIKDAENRSTTLEFGTYTSNVHINSRSAYTNPPTSDLAGTGIYLEKVTRPTGMYSFYTYEDSLLAYNYPSTKDFKRILTSKDHAVNDDNNTNNDDYNLRGYDYSNTSTFHLFGTTEVINPTGITWGNYLDFDGKTEITEYYKSVMCKKTTKNTTNSFVYNRTFYDVTYPYMTNGLPTSTREDKYEYPIDTNPVTNLANYEWDDYGNLLSSSDSNDWYNYALDNCSRVMYIYGNDSNNVPNKNIPVKEYNITKYEGGNYYAVVTVNTITNNKITKSYKYSCKIGSNLSSIVETSVSDMSETKFTYDTYGNILSNTYSELAYAPNSPPKQTITNYIYDIKYYIYPAKTTVKDADRSYINGLIDFEIDFKKYSVDATISDEYFNSYFAKHSYVCENIVSNLAPGTTVDTFKSNIEYDQETLSLIFYNSSNTVITGSTVLGTGSYFIATNADEETETYIILVTGDVNGSGSISISDLMAVQYYNIGSTDLSGVYALAADVDSNGKIDEFDKTILTDHILTKPSFDQVDRTTVESRRAGISFGNYGLSETMSAEYSNPKLTDQNVELQNIVSNVAPATTITTFKSNIILDFPVSIKFYSSTGSLITNDSTILGTGSYFKLTDGKGSKLYTILVLGDVDGSGYITSTDGLMCLQYASGSKDLLGIKAVAADVNCDGKIDESDQNSISNESVQNYNIDHSKRSDFVSYSKNTYNKYGNVATSIDADGNVTTYTYNNVGDMTQTDYPEDKTTSTQYYYGSNYAINTAIDGTQTKTVFDALGNVHEEYKRAVDTADFELTSHNTFDSQNRPDTTTQYSEDNLSKYTETTYSYDILGRTDEILVKNKDNQEISKVQYEFAVSQISDDSTNYYMCTTTKEKIDEVNSVENFKVTKTYTDCFGRNKFIETFYSDTQEYTDQYTYAWYSKLMAFDTETSNSMDFTYDAAGNQVTSKSGTNAVITKVYNGLGEVVEVKDPNTQSGPTFEKTLYEYDGEGRVIEEKIPFDRDANQNVIYKIKKNSYNVNGQLEEVKHAYIIDESGQPLFNSTRYEYNVSGQIVLVGIDDGNGNKTYSQFAYDAEGRKVRQYTGLTAPLTISQTVLDDVKPNGDTTYSVAKYSYDLSGNMTGYTDPTGNTESYTYYFDNKLKTKTLRNGKKISYVYADNGAISQVITGDLPEPTPSISPTPTPSSTPAPKTITFTYNMLNWLKTATDENNVNIVYGYDDLGRMETETRGDYAKEYEYYSTSAIKTLSLKKSNTLKLKQGYTYKTDGKLLNLNVYNLTNTNTVDYSLNYEYDANGNITDKTYTSGANSIKQEFEYNLANIVEKAKQSTGTTVNWTEDYTYRIDGNMTDKREYLGTSTTVNKNTVYSYDSAGRLTQETYKEGATTKWTNDYTFDDYNNRETMVNTDVTNSNTKKTTYYTYDKANQLIREETTSNGATTDNLNYRYDNSGNLVAKESQTNGLVETLESHTYDEFNRVSGMTIGQTTTSFTYDANDHRVSKTTSGVVTNQICSGDNIICDDVITNNTSFIKTYIQGNDTEAMITNAENSSVYNFYANIYNGRGDVVKSMQLGGSTSESYQFDAFGNNTSDATYTIPNPFLYSGEYTDSETGKQYLRARYYDPTTGRFTQEDTNMGSDDNQFSLNLYTYCEQNPVMYMDPSGHSIIDDLLKNCLNSTRGIYRNLSHEFGFNYDPEQNIYYSRIDPWQKTYGYMPFYNTVAKGVQCELLDKQNVFVYGNYEWNIWIWKGRYIWTAKSGYATGAEIGIYKRPTDWDKMQFGWIGIVPGFYPKYRIKYPLYKLGYYDAAYDDQMKMKFKLISGKTTVFTRTSAWSNRAGTHWWLTGFKRNYYSTPNSLKMEIDITFPNSVMANSFKKVVGGNAEVRGETTVHFTW
jgi:RHS repeat-associated protein